MTYQTSWVILCQNHVEEKQWYYVTNSWENNRVQAFAKGNKPKLNVNNVTGVRTCLLSGCILAITPGGLPPHGLFNTKAILAEEQQVLFCSYPRG